MTLPGLTPSVGMFAGTKKLELLTTLTWSATSGLFQFPEDISSGDLIVCHNFLYGVGNFSISSTIPTGFTGIHNYGTTWNDGGLLLRQARLRTSYKVAVGDEGGTTGSGIAASPFSTVTHIKMIKVFKFNKPIKSVSIVDAGGQITQGNPSSRTIDAHLESPPMIVAAFFGGHGAISETFNPAADEVVSAGSNRGKIAWKWYPEEATPQQHTFDMPDTGDISSHAGCIFLLSA